MPNRLIHETSPYLRQHAHNPVDWYPWGAEALERARRDDRPILLSIGYAACHWCHVMERESFEDDATAALMNQLFVNIKVDREERPDLDGIYMQAVQAMTGHGGWPMTVFLTPEGVPFYGGTYYPPDDRHGLPSFRRVLAAVSDAYRSKPDRVAQTTASMRELYGAAAERTRSAGTLEPGLLTRAFATLVRQYDARHGGFGGAPKFPAAMALDFLLRHWARQGQDEALEMALHSFRAMARGGIYDQVGGGFARYAVDATWLVPHFEKMLYDNALLLRLAVQLWQATGDAEVRRVGEETLDWLAREMTSESGGFYSSLDADSEGHEGKFYVWSREELDALLGDDAPIVRAYYGVTDAGNFEGRNILHVADDPERTAERLRLPVDDVLAAVARARPVLHAARETRVRPGRDEKILASWNGLALRALAEAARVWGRDADRGLALAAGAFLRETLVREEAAEGAEGTDGARGGRLRVMRTHTAGVTKLRGYLEDHAAMALAFLALYELTFDRRWLDDARRLADSVVHWFWSDDTGAFFDTAADHESLIARPREATDNATPSGTSLAVELLLRLAELLHDVDMRRRATYVLETMAEPMARYPTAFGHLLGAADLAIHGATELAIIGDPDDAATRALLDASAAVYTPALVLAGGPPATSGDIALLADRPMQQGRPTAYLCRNYACEAPTTDPAALAEQLSALTAARR